MKVIACIGDPVVIMWILEHLKHKAETAVSPGRHRLGC